ncbi:hypothetical protein BFJ69_g6705 [Fusarium oxysporum]|uniref:Uncharacterized protein n=1 Tax=Fusarium oxysporum TaxID=5507 RepID=A0A420N911_FUSOX|nr:hypothetical protein BFJ69_g6705 [Fusarium oxysporum]
MAASLFTCALLIPSLFTPYVTASYSHDHARLNQTDREVGNEEVQVKSTGNMSEGIHVSKALTPHAISSASTQGQGDYSRLSALTAATGGTPGRQSDARDFDLVDLMRLFPEGQIPSDTSDLQYGLITFGAVSDIRVLL